jgi:two-component sensor histidine kinase
VKCLAWRERTFAADTSGICLSPPKVWWPTPSGSICSNGEIVTSDRVLIRADNTLVSVEMRTGRMPDGTYQSIFRDISERKRHEQQLSTALQEKEVLLREVHHRVKNNLAAIIGLMDMQRRTLEDPGSQVILTELSNRIRSMSLVHEKLYRADSLESIDFQDYTQSMISHLRTTFGSPDIICRVDAPGVTIPLDLASPCGLIVNELVTNALKYAFPEGKPRSGNQDCRVLVRLHRENSTYTLTVADNGIGWPLGFDWTKTRTLGMILVRMLGQHQLGGRYIIDQKEGTSITLSFTDRKKGEQSSWLKRLRQRCSLSRTTAFSPPISKTPSAAWATQSSDRWPPAKKPWPAAGQPR